MSVVAIIQARMGSTRLPGKVLRDLGGRPMLERVVRRVQRATRLDDVVVATTVHPSDDPLVARCEQHGWPVFRGNETDVLDRYLQAAQRAEASWIVRITADCPMVDPALIDATIEATWADPALDYAATFWPVRTFPRGLDVEVVRRAALERAGREATTPSQREHVTPYLYQHPHRFQLGGIRHPEDLSAHRWTVDTPDDLALAERIYRAFETDDFAWTDVLAVLERHPAWVSLNAHVAQKPVDA
ncbi:MAG: glycosyltransferase family protein [Bacteroidota bacterium]